MGSNDRIDREIAFPEIQKEGSRVGAQRIGGPQPRPRFRLRLKRGYRKLENTTHRGGATGAGCTFRPDPFGLSPRNRVAALERSDNVVLRRDHAVASGSNAATAILKRLLIEAGGPAPVASFALTLSDYPFGLPPRFRPNGRTIWPNEIASRKVATFPLLPHRPAATRAGPDCL